MHELWNQVMLMSRMQMMLLQNMENLKLVFLRGTHHRTMSGRNRRSCHLSGARCPCIHPYATSQTTRPQSNLLRRVDPIRGQHSANGELCIWVRGCRTSGRWSCVVGLDDLDADNGWRLWFLSVSTFTWAHFYIDFVGFDLYEDILFYTIAK